MSNVVVLDRDGVINFDSDDYIKSPEEWLPIPGSLGAIARLTTAGYRIIVVTNQSGLARGLFDEITLANIHHKLRHMVVEAGGFIDAIFYCPHLPSADCACRKPGTGLLEQAEKELDMPLAGCRFIGDSLKDLQAARAHGCEPVLVRTGKGQATEGTLADQGFETVPVYDDLAAAVNAMLGAGDA